MEHAVAAKHKLGMLSGHMAWCVLVALALARRDGSILSPAQENLFLTRWLATAKKQRRQMGVNAKLVSKITYLWESCTGELKAQTDMFRLTHAIETAKDMHWMCRMLSNREWSGRHAVALNSGVNGVYLSTGSLDAAFDDDCHQVGTLLVNITGNVAGFAELLDRSGWRLEHQSGHHYHLWACQKGSS